jgi:hypothetical protein
LRRAEFIVEVRKDRHMTISRGGCAGPCGPWGFRLNASCPEPAGSGYFLTGLPALNLAAMIGQ